MTVVFIIAIAVLVGLLYLLYRELRRWPGPREWGHTPVWGKRIRVALVVILLLIAGTAFWAFFIEPNRLITQSRTIKINTWPKELDGFQVAVLSDIHAGSSFIDDRKLRQIVERTNQLNPQLIVILGDYISSNSWHSHRMAPEEFAGALKDLHAPLGVYSVLGNHDWWYNGETVRRALEANGIKVLEDEVLRVEARGTSLWLAGLADLWTRPQRVEQTIAKIPQGETMIALTHNPDIFPRVPGRVPLLLAGHTHGAQVKLPIFGRVIDPSDFGERYAAGYVFEDGRHLFVTTGIGTSILPVRFGVPPEIVLLTLKSP